MEEKEQWKKREKKLLERPWAWAANLLKTVYWFQAPEPDWCVGVGVGVRLNSERQYLSLHSTTSSLSATVHLQPSNKFYTQDLDIIWKNIPFGRLLIVKPCL